MKKRKEINNNDFPKELLDFFKDAVIYDSSSGSAAKVLYLDTGYYLKVDDRGKLKKEAELTKHFFEKGLGVEVLTYISSDKDYLLTRSAEGKDATHYLDNPKRLCAVIAEIMQYLHSQSYTDLPKSLKMHEYMESAEDYSKGYYDESYLIPPFQIHSKEEAWNIMQTHKNDLKYDTLIHGDYCLPNVILDNWKFTKLIDVGTGGVGDKHIDIYWAIWSFAYNLKTDRYTDYFMDAYGRNNFDYDMLKVITAFEVFG